MIEFVQISHGYILSFVFGVVVGITIICLCLCSKNGDK